jgi:hypothetical protein
MSVLNGLENNVSRLKDKYVLDLNEKERKTK